jgi:hypothetical protein
MGIGGFLLAGMSTPLQQQVLCGLCKAAALTGVCGQGRWQQATHHCVEAYINREHHALRRGRIVHLVREAEITGP